MKAILITLVACCMLTACSNHGKKIKNNNIEVYYKDGVSKDQAQLTADMLYRLDNPQENKDAVRKSFQLSVKGDTVICKMVVDEEKANEVPDESFLIIGNKISDSAFNGKPVNMILTNNKFKPVRTIFFTKVDIEEEDKKFGEKIVSGNIEVYSSGGASMDEAETLAKFLEKEMVPKNIISFQLGKEADGTNWVKMASLESQTRNIAEADIQELIHKISEEVFNNAPVVFQLADVMFKPYRTFNQKP